MLQFATYYFEVTRDRCNRRDFFPGARLITEVTNRSHYGLLAILYHPWCRTDGLRSCQCTEPKRLGNIPSAVRRTSSLRLGPQKPLYTGLPMERVTSVTCGIIS